MSQAHGIGSHEVQVAEHRLNQHAQAEPRAHGYADASKAAGSKRSAPPQRALPPSPRAARSQHAQGGRHNYVPNKTAAAKAGQGAGGLGQLKAQAGKRVEGVYGNVHFQALTRLNKDEFAAFKKSLLGNPGGPRSRKRTNGVLSDLLDQAATAEDIEAIVNDFTDLRTQRGKVTSFERTARGHNFEKAFTLLKEGFGLESKRAVEFLKAYSGSTDSIHSLLTSLQEIQDKHGDSIAQAMLGGNPGLGLVKQLHELVDQQTASRLAQLDGYSSQPVAPDAGGAKEDVAVVSGKNSPEPAEQLGVQGRSHVAQHQVANNHLMPPTGRSHNYRLPPSGKGDIQQNQPLAARGGAPRSQPQQPPQGQAAAGQPADSQSEFFAMHQQHHHYQQQRAFERADAKPEAGLSRQDSAVKDKPIDGGNDAEVQGVQASQPTAARDTKAVETAIKTTLMSKFGFSQQNANYFIGDARTGRYIYRLETKQGSDRKAGLEELASELEKIASSPELVTSHIHSTNHYRVKTDRLWGFINKPGSFEVQKALVDHFGFWVKNARKFVSDKVPWHNDLPQLAEQLNALANKPGISGNFRNSQNVKELVAALQAVKNEKQAELENQFTVEANPLSNPPLANPPVSLEIEEVEEKPAEKVDLLADQPEDDEFEDMYNWKQSPTGKPFDEGEPSKADNSRKDIGRNTAAQSVSGEEEEAPRSNAELVSDNDSEEGASSVEDDASVLFDNQDVGEGDPFVTSTTRGKTTRGRTRGN